MDYEKEKGTDLNYYVEHWIFFDAGNFSSQIYIIIKTGNKP